MTGHRLHPANVFLLLHGLWQLDRNIPGHATMRGRATVLPQTPATDDQPANNPPLDDRPIHDRPANDWPTNDRPTDVRPIDDQPANERPINDRPINDRPAAETALYTEQVELHTPRGDCLAGTARYLFSQHPDGDLDVHLPATGALFHTLQFTCTAAGHLEAKAHHRCAADTYTSTYRFTSPDHLAIEHIVHGPRKHYTSHTTLTRAHSPL